MSRPDISRAGDEQILAMLDMRDGDNVRVVDIAARFGMSKNAAVGKLNRIDKAEDPKRILEGSMPRGWWKQ